MAQEHVMLVQDLYSRSDLPSKTLQLRKQALSAAHYSAATACLPMARQMARRHFLDCLRYYPLYPLLYPKRSVHSILVVIETIMLPARVRNFLVHGVRKLTDSALIGQR